MEWKVKITQKSLLRFLVIILIGKIVNGMGNHCKKGQVKDLDGKCVKKEEFILPERKACPPPSVVNGEAILLSSRLVMFSCNNDEDYVMVPDTERAICKILGSWSKTVPSCLLPGCATPSNPDGGLVLMEFNDTLAHFTCSKGFNLLGDRVLGCLDGTNWNSTFPTCEKIVTSTPAIQATPVAVGVTAIGVAVNKCLSGVLMLIIVSIDIFI